MEFDEKEQFLHRVLFGGLTNRNAGFDSSTIPHVSPEDFEIVIDHCVQTGAGICGIEIFDVTRWERDGQVDFCGVWFPPKGDLEWARALARQYAGQPSITVCASFYTPEEMATHKADPQWREQLIDLEDALGGGIRKHAGTSAQDQGDERPDD